jgi:type I restriction enzyme M protein
MNLFLHGIGGADISADPPIRINDSLLQPPSEAVDMVLANPPFGRKSSVTMVGADGEIAKTTRSRVKISGRLPRTSS